MQSINFEPVCIEFQEKIRNYFSWNLEDDEKILKWLKIRISQNISEWNEDSRRKNFEDLALRITSNDNFIVVGANITEKEIKSISDDSNIVVADGAIGAIISYRRDLIKNITCLVSDADGIPYIIDNIIDDLTILLHAHGHAKDNIEYVLNIWEKWEKKPKIIISHQTSKKEKDAHNFGGFTDGDRGVCLLHSFGKLTKNIQLMGFNSQNIGPWSGKSKTNLKSEKLKWMETIIMSLGYKI